MSFFRDYLDHLFPRDDGSRCGSRLWVLIGLMQPITLPDAVRAAVQTVAASSGFARRCLAGVCAGECWCNWGFSGPVRRLRHHRRMALGGDRPAAGFAGSRSDHRGPDAARRGGIVTQAIVLCGAAYLMGLRVPIGGAIGLVLVGLLGRRSRSSPTPSALRPSPRMRWRRWSTRWRCRSCCSRASCCR